MILVNYDSPSIFIRIIMRVLVIISVRDELSSVNDKKNLSIKFAFNFFGSYFVFYIDKHFPKR